MHLNPFRTGQGLSTQLQNICILTICLNPFGTGQGLSTQWANLYHNKFSGLNPFRTGQGLSTN